MLPLVKRHSINALCACFFWGLLAIAAFFAFVTFATNDYLRILTTGLCFAAAAVVPLSIMLVLGPWQWRIAAFVFALPLSFVMFELLRRLGV
jgi:hypothetical protein